MSAEKEIFNFSNNENRWNIINDDVMGGISQSSFSITDDGYAVFEGNLSPENNGGFASARIKLNGEDLTNFDGVIIRAKGELGWNGLSGKIQNRSRLERI